METANILVCEDERLVARDIELALQRNGYSVAGVAVSGEEALEIARDKMPDLALMDIRLNGPISGIEVASRLSHEYSIPSIYLTAYADEETIEEAKSTMPLSYLLKPFDERELRTAVEVGLFRHRQQLRVINALQQYIDQLSDTNAVEKAVELERQFMMTEMVDSYLRVAGNIAGRLQEDVSRIGSLVRPLIEQPGTLDAEREPIRSALVHQERAIKVINKLLVCAEGTRLDLQEHLIQPIISQAASEAGRILNGQVHFPEIFAPEPICALIDRSQIREALIDTLLDAQQIVSGDSVVPVVTSFAYEEFPERYNARALPGWYIRVRIGDSGQVVERETLQRAFEPCYLRPVSPAFDSVGLCAVHSIMQQHLGWIHINSDATGKTVIELYFPSVDPPGRFEAHGEVEARINRDKVAP